LAFTQVLFGLGSVIAALGLPACNPFAFCLYREVAAGMILWLASRIFVDSDANKKKFQKSKTFNRNWQRRWMLLLLGGAVFGNQAGFILGIKLAGPVAAAVWQPSQPIITTAIAMLW
jgi:drug/metabolite transporter (DMT)-like permease